MQHIKSKITTPRLAIISTHPIQYNAPWFKILAGKKDIELKVFYTWSQRQEELFDAKFGREIRWDIPLLEGYDYSFVENPARDPGNHHFFGITCPSLIKEIKDWNATHLLVMGWNFKAHLSAMRHFKGKIPVLFRGDSTLLDETGGYKTLIRRTILKWVYRHIDLALYVGSSNKAYFLAHGVAPKKLVYAPHAIDNDRFREAPGKDFHKEVEKWRKELNIDPHEHVILFVGKFETKKDPLLLLSAFRELQKRKKKEHPLSRLLFVGNGKLEEELRQASEGMNVSFLPFQNQSQMPLVYRLGNVLCLPSGGPGESWGLVINEALSSGTPCIISDKAGCAADLGKLEGNQVFPYGNRESLVQCLENANHTLTPDQESFFNTWNFDFLTDSILRVVKLSS